LTNSPGCGIIKGECVCERETKNLNEIKHLANGYKPPNKKEKKLVI